MNRYRTHALIALIFSAAAFTATAQAPADPPQGGPRGPRGGSDGDRPHPPSPPISGALDANPDGVIDETKTANAAQALKSLDKNGDGKLTMEELMPPPPRQRGPRGPGEGQPGGGDGGGFGVKPPRGK